MQYDRWIATCDFTSFSTVFQSSGHWAGDNERRSAVESHLPLKRFLHPGIELTTTRSADQQLTTELPEF